STTTSTESCLDGVWGKTTMKFIAMLVQRPRGKGWL
ncbi:hypothetical protein PHMEG_00029798, partial [Phytophthora megakarya]